MSTNRDMILTQWKQAQAELAKWKEQESNLRKQVVEAFSEDAKPGHSGTENVEIGWGHKLKIVHKLNYRLDTADDSAKVDKALEAIEQAEDGGYIIAERLVKWKPELAVGEYKKLDPKYKALIDAALTITDATPEVSLVPPKGA